LSDTPLDGIEIMLHECTYVKTAQDEDLGISLCAQPHSDVLILISTGVFEQKLPSFKKLSNSSNVKPILKNRSDSTSQYYELIGINETSVRGMSVHQAKRFLSKIQGEVKLLVRSNGDIVSRKRRFQMLPCYCACEDGCYLV
jgi:hypothetical protein